MSIKISSPKSELTLEKRWELFTKSLIGQDAVKDNFRILFNSIFLTEKFGTIKNKTLGAILLAGPTGVGKTQFAEALALAAHKNKNFFMKINMGEFQNSHETAKLFGAPPGYLGHRETTAILSARAINSVKSEYSETSIILWDEVEKAHPDVYNALLGLLDRAEVRLGDNSVVNFEKTFHIFTTNLGSMYDADQKVYFQEQKLNEEYRVKKQQAAINKFFRKEFLGRLTDVFYFTELTEKELHQIVQYEIARLLNPCLYYASQRGFNFTFKINEETIGQIIKEADAKQYGARDVINVLHKNIYVPVLSYVDELLREKNYKTEENEFILDVKYSAATNKYKISFKEKTK